jgi:hypothetical protein
MVPADTSGIVASLQANITDELTTYYSWGQTARAASPPLASVVGSLKPNEWNHMCQIMDQTAKR